MGVLCPSMHLWDKMYALSSDKHFSSLVIFLECTEIHIDNSGVSEYLVPSEVFLFDVNNKTSNTEDLSVLANTVLSLGNKQVVIEGKILSIPADIKQVLNHSQ